jgi:hypothetical protein
MTEELIKEIEQRAEKFVDDNFKSATEDRRMANWLIIKQAMMIGASIMLEHQAKEDNEALKAENDELLCELFKCPCGEEH